MNRKNLKGFSLVEVATVLLIIGIIAVAALSASRAIYSSKARREAGKPITIGSALGAYYDKYGRLPGDDGTYKQDIISTVNTTALNVLMDQDYLNSNTLKIYNEKGDIAGTWRFIRCIPKKDAGYTLDDETTVSQGDIGGVCVYGNTAQDPYTAVTKASRKNYVSSTYIPYAYELFFDDANLLTGVGRIGASTLTGTFTNDVFEEGYKNPVTSAIFSGSGYMIKVW